MVFGLCCGCDHGPPATLKAFDPGDGALIWERALLWPSRSTDGKIFGVAYEKATGEPPRSYHIIGLQSPFGFQLCRRGLASTTENHWKCWLRSIDEATGLTISDSDYFWYQNTGTSKAPPQIPGGPLSDFLGGGHWIPDYFLVDENGHKVITTSKGGNTNGVLVIWDSGNITTTRRYSLVASPYTSGSMVATVIAEANGIHGEVTNTITGMRGITATDFATALAAALPDHIVSCTATGGPWPENHLDFEVEWEHDTYHFLRFGMSGGTMNNGPQLRDAMTGNMAGWATNVTASTISLNYSTGANWMFTTDGKMLGIGSNPGLPVFPTIELWDASSGGVRDFTMQWIQQPTADRLTNRKPNGEQVVYSMPAVRSGRILVSHLPAQGVGQGSTEHCCWQELDAADGSIIAAGTVNHRYPSRTIWASDSHIAAFGATDKFTHTDFPTTSGYDGYQVQYPGSWFSQLLDDTALTDPIYNGSYGISPSAATVDTMYTTYPHIISISELDGSQLEVPVIGPNQNFIATLGTGIGQSGNSVGDTWFPVPYNRTWVTWFSPVNCRWNPDILTWRYAFGGTDTAPAAATPWFNFWAEDAEVVAALATVLGVDDFGQPNVRRFTSGAWDSSSHSFLPQMYWQQDITLETKTNRNIDPDQFWGLASSSVGRVIRVQVKTTVSRTFVIDQYDFTQLRKNTVEAVNWSDATTLWSRKFGRWATSSGSYFTQRGLLTAGHFVVKGPPVSRELDPEEVVDFGTTP